MRIRMKMMRSLRMLCEFFLNYFFGRGRGENGLAWFFFSSSSLCC